MQELHSSSTGEALAEAAARTGPTVSKSQFAKLAGVSPSRVSQMIGRGLPVEPNGRIDVARGRCWIADNIDQGRAEAQHSSAATGQATMRFGGGDEKKSLETELTRIELEKARGSLVDRALVERVVFGAARAERDAWLTWPLRIAAGLAAEIGIEESILLPALKRAVRDQLHAMSEVDLEIR